MGIKTYRDLDIWKKGIELVKAIYDSISKELRYITESDEAALLERLDHIGRMTSTPIKKL